MTVADDVSSSFMSSEGVILKECRNVDQNKTAPRICWRQFLQKESSEDKMVCKSHKAFVQGYAL